MTQIINKSSLKSPARVTTLTGRYLLTLIIIGSHFHQRIVSQIHILLRNHLDP